MSVVKILEVLSQSEKSWEHAADLALEQASKSVRNIKSIYIKDLQGIVKDGKISQYRINAKISFEVE